MEFYLTVLLVRINDDKEKIVRYLIVLLLFQSQLAFAVLWPTCDRVESRYDPATRLYTNTMYFSLHEYDYPKLMVDNSELIPADFGNYPALLYAWVTEGPDNSAHLALQRRIADLPSDEVIWKAASKFFQPVVSYTYEKPQEANWRAVYAVYSVANIWVGRTDCQSSAPPPPPEPLKCFTTTQDMLFDFGTIAIGTVPNSKTLQLGVQCTGPLDGMLKGRVVSTSGSTPVSLGGGTATLRVNGDTPGSKYFTFKYGTTSIPIQVDIRNVRAGKWSASTVLSLNFD